VEVVVSIFAVVVAFGCFVAIYLASKKERDKEKKDGS